MIRTAGISAALHGVMEDNGRKAVGDRIDVARSTLGDWGTDIRSWPADKLLEAGHAYPEVQTAILEAWANASPAGRSSDLTRDAHAVNITGNRTLATVAEHLADGTYSPAEAREDLPALREHMAKVRRLILDAEAVAAVAGQIGGRS